MIEALKNDLKDDKKKTKAAASLLTYYTGVRPGGQWTQSTRRGHSGCTAARGLLDLNSTELMLHERLSDGTPG